MVGTICGGDLPRDRRGGADSVRAVPRRTRSPRRLLWPPDKRDRLTVVAGCLGGCASVLDVGGRGRELAGLLPGARVVSANLEAGADVLLRPDAPLPFADGAFAAVASSDVLEHVPPALRAAHVGELVRVARERIVLCCPRHTPAHAAAEERLAATLERDLGVRLGFLDEHLRYGLPADAEVVAMFRAAAPAAELRLGFQGDYEAGDRLLLDGARARWRRDAGALLSYLRGAYLDWPPASLAPRPGPASGRLFVIADRTRPARPAAHARSRPPSAPS